MGYLFGGNTGIKSAADLERERLLVEALMGSTKGPPKTFGEGLSALGDAIGYRVAKSRLSKDEGAASEAGNKLFASLFGGRQDTTPDTAPTYATDTTAAEPNLPAVTAELGYSPDTPAIDPTQAQAIPQPNAAPQQMAQNSPVHPLPGTPEFQDLISKYELVLGDPSFQNLDPARQKIANDRYQNLLKQQDEATDPYKQQLLKNSQLEYDQKLHPDQIPMTALQKAQIEALQAKGAGGGTPPSGYRYKADGSGGLEAIPGGPAAPDSSIAKDIAKGIVEGSQPPNTQGLYRYGAQVRAELAQQGFDLSKAQLEFNATTRALATMNGPQQTRMRQNIGTLSESLPLVRDLATQWKAGKYPILNKATLVLATQGTLGPDAQSLANRLQAQIADVTAELGSVYMGGNSPTDHAFDLAAKSLSADWSETTLLDMVKLAETNVRYRQNALNQPVAGIPNNPYDPRQAVPTISPSFPLQQGQDSQGTQGQQLPDGWTQEEWDVLTDEEKAQFGQ